MAREGLDGETEVAKERNRRERPGRSLGRQRAEVEGDEGRGKQEFRG